MIGVRRRLLLALALVPAVGACAGEEGEQAEPTVRMERAAPTRSAPALPPPLPRATVVLVDGDTRKPVRNAVVSVAGERVRTDRGGRAEFEVAKKGIGIRVSARRYDSRKLRLDLRHRLVHRFSLWRPDLQWPMYGANPARTQVHSRIGVRPPFRTVWTRHFGALLEFPAVVWNGVAYANNIRGILTAVSMSNGRVLWRTHIGSLIASSPAVDAKRGQLVTTTMRPGNVTVVSMKTGHVRWRYPTGLTEPSPVIRGRVAYFGATNGNVYALDLERRRARWIYRGGVKITSSPALVGNRLYFGDYAGRVLALNARTGRVVWRGSAGTRVYGTVAVAGGRVFAPSVFSGLSALSAKSGRLLWRIPSGAYMYSSPAVYRGRVYFGTYAGYVACANARTGRIIWRRPAGGRVSGAVQIVGGVVYAASLEERITAWTWRNGRELWSFPSGKYVPISGNGARLLVHGPGRVWAVEHKRRR